MSSNNLLPGAVWITGISSSGKSTTGENLYKRLVKEGFKNIEILDGEELRKHLDREYGFTTEERFAVHKNIVRVALEKIQSGKLVIVCTINHKLAMREMAREKIDLFMEVYLKCDVDVCVARDYKGNYKQALAGECDNFIGVTEPYEVSKYPELVLDTGKLGIEECSELLYQKTLSKFKKKANNQPSIHVASPFRSGSALFGRMLNAHSQIALLHDDIKYFRYCYNRYLPLTENNVKKMLDDLAHRLLTRYKIKVDVQACLDTIKQQPIIDDASIYSTILKHLLDSHNKKIIGEMESSSWTKIPLFLDMFPNGKAFLIIRDLRDVLMSFKKVTIAPGNDYLIALFNVIGAMDYFLDCQKKFPDRFYGIRYEALKENPEREIKKVCQFLGVEYEPGMIVEDNWTVYDGDKWGNTVVSSFHKDGDSKNPVGRWRKLISPEELYLCEWIGRKQMQAFNMKFEGNPVSQEVFDTAIKMVTSSSLLREVFKNWCDTGTGVEKTPLDPHDPKTWDKNPTTT
jgi:adenylylsulfate kinase